MRLLTLVVRSLLLMVRLARTRAGVRTLQLFTPVRTKRGKEK